MDNSLELKVSESVQSFSELKVTGGVVCSRQISVSESFSSFSEFKVSESSLQSLEVSDNFFSSADLDIAELDEAAIEALRAAELEIAEKLLIAAELETASSSTEIVKVEEDIPKVPCSTVAELNEIVKKNWREPTDPLNEVYPGIYIGDEPAAKNIDLLKRLKMTHILNAAWSEKASFIYVNTSQEFYTTRNFDCNFMGIRAVDSPTFRLCKHFEESSDFIEKALSDPAGKVLVHCRQGISRSATLVIVYLMMRKNMAAKEAVSLIRKKRNIFPNQGFMKEICALDESLMQSRTQTDHEN